MEVMRRRFYFLSTNSFITCPDNQGIFLTGSSDCLSQETLKDFSQVGHCHLF
jgi:hypothetical protein